MTVSHDAGVDARPRGKRDPVIKLHAWHGLSFSTFARLLARNGFAFSPRLTHRVVVIFFTSLLNSGLNRLDRLVYARRVAAVRVEHDPVFIIGHWRTGTTLLHELLSCDERLVSPDTYQCMAPGHFLLTRRVLPPVLGFLLPRERPMDEMPIGWHRPMEDEFALLSLGLPTMYRWFAYPDRPCPHDRYLDLSGLTGAEREGWKSVFMTFIRRLTFRDPRRIVLKSPTHTARIRTMLELFPRAKFVHLVRDPQAMIPSTVRTWRRLAEFMGLRTEIRDDLLDYVLGNYRRMYRAYDEQRALIPDGQFFELRYEDLAADMAGSVGRLYEHLSLGGFAAVRPRIEAYVSKTAGYRTNRFDPDPETRRRIAAECADYCARHGYPAPAEPATAAS